VPPQSTQLLEENVRTQQARGCEVHLLSPGELRMQFPSMRVDDVGAGAHSPRDGWCDPNSLLWGLRKKSAAQGATFIQGRVTAMQCDAHRVKAAVLADGDEIEAEYFVNAAGAWSNQIASMAGM